jgi:hypothetical protein
MRVSLASRNGTLVASENAGIFTLGRELDWPDWC